MILSKLIYQFFNKYSLFELENIDYKCMIDTDNIYLNYNF
jgi:hypothetical protein